MKIIVASSNKNKIREISQVLAPKGIDVASAADFGGMPDVVEDGTTFQENARKKAIEGARALGLPVLADDSGLSVDALDGAPGVYSARYAGEGGNDGRNVAKLLKNLDGIENRCAHFTCHIAIADPDGTILAESEGCVYGKIASAPAGNGGFGYDPVFVPDGYDRTFGELPADVKNRISHRSRALASIAESICKIKITN